MKHLRNGIKRLLALILVFAMMPLSITHAFGQDELNYRWDLNNSGFTNNLNSICSSSKGTLLAVGDDGTIFISYDKKNWKYTQLETKKHLNSVCYDNGLFVIVGDNGTIFNGKESTYVWNLAESGTKENLSSVCYDPVKKIFLVVGDNGIILESEDGTNWIKQTSGIKENLTGVVAASIKPEGEVQHILVAVGEYGRIISSDDGINWVQHPLSIHADFYGVGCCNGEIVAVGAEGTTYRSYDRNQWEGITSYFGKASNANIFAGSDMYMAGAENKIHMLATDGECWDFIDIGDSSIQLNDIYTADGKTFYAVGNKGRILRVIVGENISSKLVFHLIKAANLAIGIGVGVR